MGGIPIGPGPRGAPGARRRTKDESRLWDLYLGELNPLVTNRANFWLVWAVTAVIAVVALPFFYEFVEGYFLFAYAILPSFTTAVAATTYTRDRASGFAAVVQTAPVSNTEYFLSKFLASMTLGVVFLVITLPFTGLVMYYLGSDALWASFASYLLFTIPLMVVSTCLGLFISVAIGKRGLVASAMTGFGLTVVFAGAGVALNELRRELSFSPAMQQEAADNPLFAILAVLTDLSHLAPLVNAFDFADAYPGNMDLAWKNLFTVLWMAAALGAGAWFLYSKFQNVEGWDAPKWASAGAVAGIVIVAAAPAFVLDYPVAAGGYQSYYGPDFGRMPFMAYTAFVPVGMEYAEHDCIPCRYAYDDPDNPYYLEVGETAEFQVYLLVERMNADPGATFRDVKVRLIPEGQADLRLSPDAFTIENLTIGRDGGRQAIRLGTTNVTVTGTENLGESHAVVNPEITFGNTTYKSYSMFSFTIGATSYRWYYPLVVLGGLTVAEAAPFVWRSRKVGKRGK